MRISSGGFKPVLLSVQPEDLSRSGMPGSTKGSMVSEWEFQRYMEKRMLKKDEDLDVTTGLAVEDCIGGMKALFVVDLRRQRVLESYADF